MVSPARLKPSAKFILQVRPIPVPLHGYNLRTAIGKYQWQKKLRPQLVETQKDLGCHKCGSKPENASSLQAHEEWSYDTSTRPAKARLETINLVCVNCHRCEHFMLTERLVDSGIFSNDDAADAIDHFCRLNKTTKAAFKRHLAKAEAENERLSKLTWRLDFGGYAQMLNTKALRRLHCNTDQLKRLARRERKLTAGKSGFSPDWILVVPAGSYHSLLLFSHEEWQKWELSVA